MSNVKTHASISGPTQHSESGVATKSLIERRQTIPAVFRFGTFSDPDTARILSLGNRDLTYIGVFTPSTSQEFLLTVSQEQFVQLYSNDPTQEGWKKFPRMGEHSQTPFIDLQLDFKNFVHLWNLDSTGSVQEWRFWIEPTTRNASNVDYKLFTPAPVPVAPSQRDSLLWHLEGLDFGIQVEHSTQVRVSVIYLGFHGTNEGPSDPVNHEPTPLGTFIEVPDGVDIDSLSSLPSPEGPLSPARVADQRKDQRRS